MRCLYIIGKVLLVVFILTIIINILLYFSPFSIKESRDEVHREDRGSTESSRGKVLPEKDGTRMRPMESQSDALEETIGKSAPEDGDAGDRSCLQSKAGNGLVKYFMTYDEIMSLKRISLEDKLTGLNVVRKVKRVDLERILRIADGGITMEEWASLSKILRNSLEEKDIEKLKKIAFKNKIMN
ncbi:MAG: hypothetical protein N3I35_05715 [Clostridia bacterium]|nr:hypothetical protein [Clostridia bacterium]